MQIEFVQLNSKYSHSSLAAWCLLAGVRRYCSENVSGVVCEGTVNEPQDALLQRILAPLPQIIGFCTYIWNVTEVKRIAAEIRRIHPEIVLVAGGPEVSYNAAEVLSDGIFDYVISGEGERPCALLAEAIAADEPVPDGYGICSVGHIAEPYTPCEEPPSPYCNEYFAALKNRMAYIETSRGCPYSCAFCLSGRCGGVRFFPMERVKSEIAALAEAGATTVKFVDRTFNANKVRAKEIVRFIAESYGGKGVCFHFEIAGDILDDELIALFNNAPAGLFQLEIGLQSFNRPTLEQVCRKTDTDRLAENIRRLVAPRNIHVHIDLIAGLPFENLSIFERSFNAAFALGADMLQLGFLKLLHGAEMRENGEKYPCKYSAEPPYEVTETPWLSADDLAVLKRTENVLDRLCNSGRFRRATAYVMENAPSPFRILAEFGQFCGKTEKITLDDFTARVYDFFSARSEINAEILRDKMICDRLSTNSFGRLPQALRREETELNTFVLSRLPKPKRGIKRSFAVLQSKSDKERICVVYAEYSDKNKLPRGLTAVQYKLNFEYIDR